MTRIDPTSKETKGDARYSFIEHKIALEDDLLQIMTKPVEFSFVNLNKDQKIENSIPSPSTYIKFTFDLSQTIRVEKRQVTSLPVLFGDLGGLYEFLATIATLLVGRIQSKLSIASQVSALFLQAGSHSSKRSEKHEGGEEGNDAE